MSDVPKLHSLVTQVMLLDMPGLQLNQYMSQISQVGSDCQPSTACHQRHIKQSKLLFIIIIILKLKLCCNLF